jgi:hypothetical protein
VVWIEHHPPETTDGSTETFDFVAFSSYEVKERAPYMGETRLNLERPPGSASQGAWWRCWWVGRCSLLLASDPRSRDDTDFAQDLVRDLVEITALISPP